jgi:hypothetical protein
MEAAILPTTIEDIFKDYKSRREGILKALTTGKSFVLSLSSFGFFCFFFLRLLLLLTCFSPLSSADVEDFYQQCDPGNGENSVLWLLSSLSSGRSL